MRFYEICDDRMAQTLLTEEALREGFIQSIVQKIGEKVAEPVTTVTNAASAMQVLFKIASDRNWLDTCTFLIKKGIKAKLKSMAAYPFLNGLGQLITRIFPQGRDVKSFLIAVVISVVMNSVMMAYSKVTNALKDEFSALVTNTLKTMANIDTLIGSVPGIDVLFKVIGMLQVADELLFKLLNDAYAKIKSLPVGQAR